MRWLAVLIGVGCAAGCSRPNPAFDSESDAEAGTAGTDSAGLSSGPDGSATAPVTTAGGSMTSAGMTSEATSGTTTGESGTDDPSDTATSMNPPPDGGGDTTGGEVSCDFPGSNPIDMQVVIDNKALPPPNCDVTDVIYFEGHAGISDGSAVLETNGCSECSCTTGKGGDSSIDFSEDIVPDSLNNECIGVWVWASVTDGGDCGWNAFLVEDLEGEGLPLFFGGNATLPLEFALNWVVDAEPEELCEEDNTCPPPPHAPGRYRLRFNGKGQTVAPGDDPITVAAPWLVDYRVEAREAHATPGCITHQSWRAWIPEDG